MRKPLEPKAIEDGPLARRATWELEEALATADRIRSERSEALSRVLELECALRSVEGQRDAAEALANAHRATADRLRAEVALLRAQLGQK